MSHTQTVFSFALLGIILLGVLTPLVFSAPTIVPVATVRTSFVTAAIDMALTFTVKNSGDILVISASDIKNGPCNNHHASVTDTQSNTWTNQVQAEQSTADSDISTATASASGSITITVHYGACSSHGAGSTAYDLVGYTLTGISSSTGTGASGS